MDKFNVFFPHLTVLFFLLLYAILTMIWVIIAALITFIIFNRKGIRSSYVWKMSSQTWEKIIFSAMSVIAGVLIIFFLVPWLFSNSLKGDPDENWHTKAKETNTAIIFGFGYGIDEKGRMTPEASNRFLYELSKKQMNAKCLIVQEGVFVVALEDRTSIHSNNIQLVRMHPLNLQKDVNTFEAARYAIKQMEKLGQTKAVVYAHSLQQKRAIANLKRIAESNPVWRQFDFISPDIPYTPFPKHSAQWRTRNRIIYRAIELYFSRVRDSWQY
jgi:hypothetical protein